MKARTVIRMVLGATCLAALYSAYGNVQAHHAYAVASRLALVGAALAAFIDPSRLERLIRERPRLVVVFLGILLALALGGVILFQVVFPPLH